MIDGTQRASQARLCLRITRFLLSIVKAGSSLDNTALGADHRHGKRKILLKKIRSPFTS
jgi:hypothetical protein